MILLNQSFQVHIETIDPTIYILVDSNWFGFIRFGEFFKFSFEIKIADL